MSTRLLTMKFMQRAAASNNSTPETTPDRRDAKRQRMSNGSYNSPPVENSDARAVRKALAVEEQKRQQAVDREAARRGETKWYLDVQPASKPETQHFTVVSAGYGSLDSDHAISNQAHRDDDSDSDADTAFQGRRSFGIKKRKANDEDEDDRAADASHDQQDPNSNRKGENDTPTSKKREMDNDADFDGDRGGKKSNLHRVKSISSVNAQNASPGKDHGRKNRKHHGKNHGKKKD